ncbi:ABC transporter permease [Echinicola salinicaeni]|uniref:ABC transporter permease n=1 Tax=Echinicola salinicaeni TaxID=2762757 RepID=UPI0016445715|nr:ABC transporter permease [Echinicola salinicaeni]
MFFRILKEYIRRMIRSYKVYLITILGMSIAIMAFFHAYLFVYKELSVDAFHAKGKDIYRVVRNDPHSAYRSTRTYAPFGELLKDKLPEVEEVVRLEKTGYLMERHGEQVLEEYLMVDPTFFTVFDFKLVLGSLDKFADTPNAIVLSEKMAQLYFPNESALGKVIEAKEDGEVNTEFIVVGVMENIPAESSIQTDFVTNIVYSSFLSSKDYGSENKWWLPYNDLYVYAPNVTDREALSTKLTTELINKIKPLFSRTNGSFDENQYQLDLQSLDEIYLHSDDISQSRKGSLRYIQVISLVGIITLLLALTNYIIMNLGLNLNRAKEFVTRRVLGASKGDILSLFVLESMINALVCFGLTMISYPLIGELIGDIIGSEYELSIVTDYKIILSFLCIVIGLGGIIGLMEYILSYNSIFVKEHGKVISASVGSKKLMIGFQLFLFIGLMSCILIVRKQLDFVHELDKGFDIEAIVGVRVLDDSNEIRNLLSANSHVESISRGQRLFRNKPSSLWNLEVPATDRNIETQWIDGDDQYLAVHDIQLKSGRNLSPTKAADYEKRGGTLRRKDRKGIFEVMVNEEFVRQAGLVDPIGARITKKNSPDMTIVGVFENLYNLPLYYPMKPMILGTDFTGFPIGLFQVRCSKGFHESIFADVANYLENLGYPGHLADKLVQTFDYAEVYHEEYRLKKLLDAFTAIVLVISMLGLVAISLFVTGSKSKEIGIRKVNGASAREILLLLNKDFVLWIAIAFLLACPVAYYAMSKWLESFAYKTALSWWVFGLAGLIVLIIALVTVSWQTYKAAITNPVNVLKDE